MSAPAAQKTFTVALLGNPNTGKSTLFTALCGVRQQTGNYPGVTVEKKTGRTQLAGRTLEIVDLPGTYSLAPRSPDEMLAVDVLLGRQEDAPRPDVILCIVDASNLERNLYLVSQILELGLPIVLALNMIDAAEGKGLKIDAALLSKRLKLPVVPVQANKRIGIPALREALDRASSSDAPPAISCLPDAFNKEVDQLLQRDPELPRYLAERLILDTSGYLARAGLPGVTPELLEEVANARTRLATANCRVPGVEPIARYQWIEQTLEGVVQQHKAPVLLADRIDRVLTHRVWGSAAFVSVMVAMFAAVFWLAQWPMEAIDFATGKLGEAVQASMEDGPLRSLLADGIIAGVGGVIIFLPQILILFLFIGALEDCGYMARAAYLMDRLMSRVGLSGKSFIPLLSSFACAIPGIMGTRVIENPRDRLATILVAPLMSCSARLPVYTLLAVAFIPPLYVLGGLEILRPIVVAAMYFLGIIAAAVVALVLKRTVLRGPTPPFVMELPRYKLPSVRGVVGRSLDRGWTFIKSAGSKSAGSLILAISILVWAGVYFPHRNEVVEDLVPQKVALEEQIASAPEEDGESIAALAEIENEMQARWLADSYLGRAGHVLEPAVRPLGWDWRIGCAAIASFPAREVIVATLGVIFNLGGEVDEESDSLHSALQNATWPDGRPLFTLPVALSIMVFFSLCAQCAATLATIRRETNSWTWPTFTFVYMTALAYVAALVTYQVGTWLAG
jgi:ferrous iron transport protein B